MNPEQLSDAMNELPQELLEETQAARSRRRPPPSSSEQRDQQAVSVSWLVPPYIFT